MAYATGKLDRWILNLFEMEFEVTHWEVIIHRAADSILRLETTDTETEEIDVDISCFLIICSKEDKYWLVYPDESLSMLEPGMTQLLTIDDD